MNCISLVKQENARIDAMYGDVGSHVALAWFNYNKKTFKDYATCDLFINIKKDYLHSFSHHHMELDISLPNLLCKLHILRRHTTVYSKIHLLMNHRSA